LHYTRLLIALILGEHLKIVGEIGGYMCKSGICDTKLSDMSETKQSIAKVTTQCL